MGSFGKIGFLSSLPISSGDETTLIFLKPNKYADSNDSTGGVTYSTDWYEPIFLPTEEWQNKLKEIIPSYGKKLNENLYLCNSTRTETSKTLKLK